MAKDNHIVVDNIYQNVNGVRIQPGTYAENDPALHDLAQNLLTNGFAHRATGDEVTAFQGEVKEDIAFLKTMLRTQSDETVRTLATANGIDVPAEATRAAMVRSITEGLSDIDLVTLVGQMQPPVDDSDFSAWLEYQSDEQVRAYADSTGAELPNYLTKAEVIDHLIANRSSVADDRKPAVLTQKDDAQRILEGNGADMWNQDMTVEELRAYAKTHDINVAANAKKETVIAQLQSPDKRR